MALFNKKNDYDTGDDGYDRSLKILSGIAKLLPAGKKQETDEYAAPVYDENQSDTQAFAGFIRDYLRELTRRD